MAFVSGPITEPDDCMASANPHESNKAGVRLYNERVALSLIRRHGSLPKAEIAQITGLSAQTVSLIVRQLGLGVAMPSQIWKWEAEIGVLPGGLSSWQDADIACRIDGRTGRSLINPWFQDAVEICPKPSCRHVRCLMFKRLSSTMPCSWMCATC